jgi:SLT domain-containing protein
VQGIAKEYGWGEGEQWEALSWIIQKESSWNLNAQNPKSTAYGLFQHLDMTRKNYNCPKTANVEVQTHCGIKYIKARYKTALEAKKFHQSKGWY